MTTNNYKSEKIRQFGRTFHLTFSRELPPFELMTLVNERDLNHAKQKNQGLKSYSKIKTVKQKFLHKNTNTFTIIASTSFESN